MKKLFLILIVFSIELVFAQEEQNDTVIFEFNNKTDNIQYRIHHNKKEIAGFNILIGKKLVFFNTSLNNNKKIKTPLKINTSRKELEKIINTDNSEKLHIFILLNKNNSKYFYVDHLVRKISCE